MIARVSESKRVEKLVENLIDGGGGDERMMK